MSHEGLILTNASSDNSTSGLSPWEALVIEAVGAVIEFWGFKVNHGKVWSLLYLRDTALSAAELQRELGLSKGAVSMITRELEHWGVVHRVRTLNESSWRFAAELDFKGMISRVLSTREAALVARITNDLREAEAKARKDPQAHPSQLERIRRLRALAEAFSVAIEAFAATARLDIKDFGEILAGGLRNALRKVRL